MSELSLDTFLPDLKVSRASRKTAASDAMVDNDGAVSPQHCHCGVELALISSSCSFPSSQSDVCILHPHKPLALDSSLIRAVRSLSKVLIYAYAVNSEASAEHQCSYQTLQAHGMWVGYYSFETVRVSAMVVCRSSKLLQVRNR